MTGFYVGFGLGVLVSIGILLQFPELGHGIGFALGVICPLACGALVQFVTDHRR